MYQNGRFPSDHPIYGHGISCANVEIASFSCKLWNRTIFCVDVAFSKFTRKWRGFKVYTKMARFQSLHTIFILCYLKLLFDEKVLKFSLSRKVANEEITEIFQFDITLVKFGKSILDFEKNVATRPKKTFNFYQSCI